MKNLKFNVREAQRLLLLALGLLVGGITQHAFASTTFADGDILFYDFSDVTGGGGVNWQANGSTMVYDPSGAGTIKCVIFTSSTTWTTSWTIAKTAKGGWANINFPSDRPSGQNCLKINSAGTSASWTTISLAEKVAKGDLIMVYGGELSSWNQSNYYFIGSNSNTTDNTKALANANKSITINNESYKFGPVALPSGTYIQGHWASNMSCAIEAGSAYVVRGGSASTTYFTQKANSGSDYLYQVIKQSSTSPTTTLSPTCPSSITAGSKLSFTPGSAGVSVLGRSNSIKYYLKNGSTYTEKTLSDGKLDVSDLGVGEYSIITLLDDGYILVKASTSNFSVTAAATATLTYHANYIAGTGSGTGSVPEAQTVTLNSSATVANKNTLAFVNYTFSGWNTDEHITGTSYAVGSSITMNENKNLYAVWTRTIPLDDQGATTAVTGDVYGTYNSSSLPSFTNPQKTGYTFQGWYTQIGGGGNFVINTSRVFQASKTNWTNASCQFIRPSTSTSSLYAKWTQTVTLNANTANHGSGTDKSATATWNLGTVTISTHCTPASGYKLEGYYTDATGGTKILNADGSFAATNITNYITDSKWTKAGATTLYAHYEALPKVYLKNTMNWENAYITFYKAEYWDATNAAGSSRASANYVADPAAMTYNESTGLFEYQCPDVYTYTYACFTKDKQDNYGNFWQTEAIYCNNNLQYEKVVVVASATNETKNETKYYTTKTNNNIEFLTLAAGEGTGWFFPGGWSSWETKGNEAVWNSSNVRFTKALDANTDYEFKVYNHGVYYGKSTSGTWTASGSKTLVSGENNCTLSTTLAGTYTFDYNVSTNSLTISYPSVYAISGSFNSWTEETNLAFSGNDGSYSVAINGSSTNYEFKVLNDGVWYSTSSAKTITATESNITLSSGGSNIQLKADVYPSGTYTFTYNKSTHKLGVTYPTNFVVNFGKRTGGNTVTAKINNTTAFNSGTKIANGTSVTFAQTAADGYTFEGWYDAETGGTKVSSSASYTTTISAATTVYANYTPNQYTVSFDNNGGSGATPGSITVTYGQAYGTLPAGPTPPDVDQFVGWFTAQTGGTQVTSSTIVSTASNHKLWARFEHTYTVTVQYKCGTDVLRAQTTTHASETSVAAEITAPEILGYEFDEWTGDNATFADATSATTTVNVTSATTVVANYAVVPMVYFKNNPSWDDVYVTFDCGFSGDVPSLSDKPYYKMSRLGSSDIFYCVIPSTYTDNNYDNWVWHIAFDNKGTGYNESTHRGTYTFNSGEFIGRKDFDPNATMFIPYVDNTQSLNGGTTYPIGCWLQYNTNYSSYKVRVNTYVQGSGGEEVQNIELRSDVAGATEFKAKVYLGNANYVYGVMLYKDYMKNTNDIWYTNVNNEANTITSATTSLPWSWEKCNDTWQRCRVKTEALGDYIFTVSFATGRPMVDIEYPVTVGDFRLVYKDLATWNVEHDASWQQTSAVFKKKVNRVDTASFFVSYGSSPALELQKCTAINPSTGAETWTKQGDNINISSITEKGVYNFTVTQNNDASSATAAYLGAYSGKYYVRTDASDGGWNDYKSSANAMTYTEYSMEHGGSSGPYSYYFMRHVNEGSNIKFVVANDYNECLTDYMIDDTYAHEWIEHEANIRFTWNHTNNEIHRAYISGSSIISDRFLVLEGDESLFDADGHPLRGDYQVEGLNEDEMNFTDDQNWVYETTVQAEPNERVKLTAKFNGKIQYFYGAEGERSEATTYQLIGGTGSTKYKMRVVYDFKTNRLLAAWLPNGDISDPTPINADVMIIRYHQQDAQQITFSDDGKLTDVKTVYGAMEFNKYRLNNQNETGGHGDLGLSPYERDLFFISFPFDVKLNDVFGFGQYGKHWIIEYYDGKTRAQKGYWIDSPTNWKFVTKAMKDSYTLKANEGYVLALDLDELTLESPVWNYGVENVYLYFPSTATVENIQATSATVNIDTVGYQCTINRDTPHGDRRVKDSHWHLIGVPSYANADHSTSNSWAESQDDLEQTIYYPNIQPAQWASAAPFVYDWDPSLNKFGVITTTTTTFKPMHSYLVQYARDTLEWRQVNATGVAAAPKRAMFAKEPCDFRLELLQNENVIDQAFISMRDDEEVTADFDFNYDLSKMLYGAFTSKSNIYTFAGNEEVAANCLPFKDETTIVPVGLTVDEEGEYIFSIPEGTSGVGVTLVDNERQTRTNLALTDYATYIAAGTHDERFVIEISPIEQIVTNVELINGENGEAALNGVSKKLIDGVLYIIKDGKVFDARGARIQ